jgi:uncharacterized repeat protein (TIGR03837 family)
MLNILFIDSVIASVYTLFMAFFSDITLLCKVVDNYGDIGFVYRLARALSALRPELKLRIVTDNLASFSFLAPGLAAHVPVQQYNGLTVYDWNAASVCTNAFSAEQPRTVLECFQCGYPEWLETLLFTTKCRDAVQVINIDYLTAEQYADDFHCLASLTRSAAVRKVNFMPGFTPKTGGLVLDGPFASRTPASYAFEHAGSTVKELLLGRMQTFRMLVFSYERDFTSIVRTLSYFEENHRSVNAEFRLQVFAAAGRGRASFMDAWNKAGKPFAATELPFLPQADWDDLLCSMTFLFVRGEDSLSRACLTGIPFVWHAYPQDDEYQRVKVLALLGRMKPYFSPENAVLLEKYWLSYNTTLQPVLSDTCDSVLYELLEHTAVLGRGFSSFASDVRGNGDFAARLLQYIEGLI